MAPPVPGHTTGDQAALGPCQQRCCPASPKPVSLEEFSSQFTAWGMLREGETRWFSSNPLQKVERGKIIECVYIKVIELCFL